MESTKLIPDWTMVLLVEDNAGDAVLIRQILGESPVPVKLVIARDGEQALQMLEDPEFTPEVIILDLNLPKLSGHAVLERNQRKDIPVVVFSSSWNETEIHRALNLGAREYVQKPAEIDAFADAVQGIISKWVARKTSGASTASGA